jgi:hypothetical protein
MVSSTGGTAAMAGRRFSATPTTTKSSAHPGRVLVGRDRLEGWDRVTAAI